METDAISLHVGTGFSPGARAPASSCMYDLTAWAAAAELQLIWGMHGRSPLRVDGTSVFIHVSTRASDG